MTTPPIPHPSPRPQEGSQGPRPPPKGRLPPLPRGIQASVSPSLHHRVLEGAPGSGGAQPCRHTQLWGCPQVWGCRGPTWGGPEQGEEQRQCQGHGGGQGRGRGQWPGHGDAGRAEPAASYSPAGGMWPLALCQHTGTGVSHPRGHCGACRPHPATLLLAPCPGVPTAMSSLGSPFKGPMAPAGIPFNVSMSPLSPHCCPHVPCWGPMSPVGFTLGSPCPPLGSPTSPCPPYTSPCPQSPHIPSAPHVPPIISPPLSPLLCPYTPMFPCPLRVTTVPHPNIPPMSPNQMDKA